MTVIEALRLSKETGRSFVRGSSKFVSWDPNWTYQFSGEEMLAADWEDVETYIPRLTKGRWGAADYPPNVEEDGQ